MAQKLLEPEMEIKSATQFRGTLTMEGVRQNAFRIVENYCKDKGLEPGQFLSNLGMMRNDRWKREGADWRDSVDHNEFNKLIFQAIPPLKEDGAVVGRRFDAFSFNRTLKEMNESYLANLVPRRNGEQQSARAPKPNTSEQMEAPEQARPLMDSQMPTGAWTRLYSKGEEVLDRYPQLDENARTTIQGIVGRGGAASTRRREEVNLTEYLRMLSRDKHVITDKQATEIYNAFMGRNGLLAQAEREVKEGREPNRQVFNQAEQQVARRTPAPIRTYRYTFTVAAADTPDRMISRFNVDSPRPIESLRELGDLIKENPAGLAVTRIGAGGKVIPIKGDQMETLGSRLVRLRYDDKYEVTLRERKAGAQG
jgi:hypothetical protein